MPYRHAALLLAALPASLLAGCDDDDDNGTEPQQFAQVQLVNASAGTTSATVSSGGQQLASGLSFQGSSTTCVRVPVGERQLTFSSGTTDLAMTDEFDFEAGQRYTVVLVGTGNGRRAVVARENFTAPATGSNAIRFVNASNAAGDVFVTTPGGQLGAQPDVAGLAAGGMTGGMTGANGFMSFPQANTQVRLFNTGQTTGPRTTFNLGNMPTTRGTTVVFTEAATTGGPTAFQVNQCTEDND